MATSTPPRTSPLRGWFQPTKLALAMVLLGLSLADCVCSPYQAGEVIACDDDGCVCQPDPLCQAACPAGGCDLTCQNGEDCETVCGDDCDLRCQDVTSCATECGADCSSRCDRLSDCDTTAGVGADVHCADVGSCTFSVGDKSVVVCERVGTCDVQCQGDCAVRCSNVGTCDVQCIVDGDITEDPTVCDDGVLACGACTTP